MEPGRPLPDALYRDMTARLPTTEARVAAPLSPLRLLAH